MTDYDLIIVGAGPAGSQLAWQFSRRGHDVLILEEHGEVGRPVACSGHLSTDIWDLVPREESLIENEIHAGVIHISGRDYEFRKDDVVSYVVRRHQLDKHVHQLATEAGTETRLNARVTGFTEREDSIEIQFYDTETREEETVESKLLAGCDGPASVVRQTAGLPDPDMLHGVFCYVDQEDASDHVELWFQLPDFFAWKIPRGETIEYGLATEKASAKEEFRKLLDREDVEADRFRAGVIPYGLLPEVTSGRVFLCGDAGSQVKPFTGGGIVYGMRCARIAAETVDPDRPETLEEYESAWRDELGTEIRLGKLAKDIYGTPLLEPLVYFASKLDHEKMHMDMPSTILLPQKD